MKADLFVLLIPSSGSDCCLVSGEGFVEPIISFMIAKGLVESMIRLDVSEIVHQDFVGKIHRQFFKRELYDIYLLGRTFIVNFWFLDNDSLSLFD